MGRPQLYPVKKLIAFDDETVALIEEWRFRRRPVPSVSEAIRQLVKEALTARAQEFAPGKKGRHEITPPRSAQC